MAQAGLVLDKDQFTCSVCLDVLREPVTIPCGHSYCSDCIRNYWDQDDYLGVFMCPQCRKSFNPRPALARSTLLADVVDRFKRSGLLEVPGGVGVGQPQQQQQSLAQADDVECDVCPGRKNKAVNSCLVCLASYCEIHVRPHHDSDVFKKHKLVSASKRLQESVCPCHHKLLEVYCRTDKRCICSMCLTDEHKGHDTVLAEVEIQQQQRQLSEMKLSSQRSIKQREKEAQELRQAIFSINRSARLAAETSDSVFADLLRCVELKRFEVRELIKAQQESVDNHAKELLEKLQKEIGEQKKREAELDRLALADDNLHFLQRCQALDALPPVTSAPPAVSVEPGLTFDPTFVPHGSKMASGVPAASATTSTISIEQDQFTCSVCLEVLRDPVTIPCGHSYCLSCIEDYWGRGNPQKAQYSCPQCRQEFKPRPLLNRNTVLGELVEKFVRSGVREKPAEERLRGRGRGGVAAPKSGAVGETLCPQHQKPLKRYCRTDHHILCSHCIDGHKNHDVVRPGNERAAQQKKLQEASLKCAQNIKEVEKELHYVVKYIKHATEAAEEESDRVFSKLLRAIEKQRCEVKEAIRGRERAALAQTQQLQDKLDRETAEVRRSEAELDKLCRSDDHLHFLQRCRSLRFPSKSVQIPETDTLPYFMYKRMREGLAELRVDLDQNLQREFDRISDKVISLKETSMPNEKTKVAIDAHILYESDPKTREDFLHYYQDLTLDPNTANRYLSLSEDHRAATTRPEAQPYPDHPERFSKWAQVLCRAGMAGRCYWEVAWAGKGGASVGVCYRSMSRSGGGSDSKLGHNAKSWSLDCSNAACTFRHDKRSADAAAPCAKRIGVYLDYRAGVLSFYNISDRMFPLYSVQATFSQPVFPGFWVGLGSTLKLCSL